MSGDTTSVNPGAISAGSWKQSDFPAPVGSTARTLRPASSGPSTFSWWTRNAGWPNRSCKSSRAVASPPQNGDDAGDMGHQVKRAPRGVRGPKRASGDETTRPLLHPPCLCRALHHVAVRVLRLERSRHGVAGVMRDGAQRFHGLPRPQDARIGAGLGHDAVPRHGEDARRDRIATGELHGPAGTISFYSTMGTLKVSSIAFRVAIEK